MSWDFWIKANLMDNGERYFVLEAVKGIISRDGLKTKKRTRDLAYRRAYLYTRLREYRFPFEFIGSLFGKDHATVMNGIKIWESSKMYDDVKEIEKEYKPQIDGEVRLYKNMDKK